MKKGTSLLEVLIYISVSILLMSSAIQITINAIIRSNKQLEETIDVACGLLSMKKEFQMKVDNGWKLVKKTPQECIIASNSNAIGWCYRDRLLKRTAGRYETIDQRWLKKHTSPLSAGITKLRFTYEKEITCSVQKQAGCFNVVLGKNNE